MNREGPKCVNLPKDNWRPSAWRSKDLWSGSIRQDISSILISAASKCVAWNRMAASGGSVLLSNWLRVRRRVHGRRAIRVAWRGHHRCKNRGWGGFIMGRRWARTWLEGSRASASSTNGLLCCLCAPSQGPRCGASWWSSNSNERKREERRLKGRKWLARGAFNWREKVRFPNSSFLNKRTRDSTLFFFKKLTWRASGQCGFLYYQ